MIDQQIDPAAMAAYRTLQRARLCASHCEPGHDAASISGVVT